MGFPHPTIDIPGSWSDIEHELTGLHFRDEYAAQLLQGLQSDQSIIAGHVCATTWIFSPDANFDSDNRIAFMLQIYGFDAL